MASATKNGDHTWVIVETSQIIGIGKQIFTKSSRVLLPCSVVKLMECVL